MKAQFLSFDAIFAIVIFIFSVSLLSFVWYSANSQFSVSSSSASQTAQFELQQMMSRIMSPGNPSNWYSLATSNSVSTWKGYSVGLGTATPGTISSQKVFALASMSNSDYQATKALLGVGYDYYITITGSNFYMSMGSKPKPLNNLLTVYVSTRSVNVNGEPAQLQVFIWTNSSFSIG